MVSDFSFVVDVGWFLWLLYCGVWWVVAVACILWMLGGCCGLCIVAYVGWLWPVFYGGNWVVVAPCIWMDIGWLIWPVFWWTLAALDMLNIQNNRLGNKNLYTGGQISRNHQTCTISNLYTGT